MLILTRKLGEKISIGSEVTVVVTEINGTNVKIGVEAPREISIYREEILSGTIRENRTASGVNLKQLQEVLTKELPKKCPSYF